MVCERETEEIAFLLVVSSEVFEPVLSAVQVTAKVIFAEPDGSFKISFAFESVVVAV